MKQFLLLPFIVSLVGCSSGKKTDESAAIIKLLEKESTTWRTGDHKGHAECWHIQPYSRILVSLADGTTIDVPPAAIVDPAAKMGNGGVSVNSNYKMSVKGNCAWVSHDEVSTATDNTRSYSYEIRLLEKIDGEWKLVGQSIHMYNPGAKK
jgi:hypothetical protein